ncbi:MAG: polyprenyl synthetase family protein, partial [Pirellulales bacterium]
AEGSPIVLKIIVSGYVDAIVGVACLNVLEKAIDKILLSGIPCMAVPLLSSDCRNTSVDEEWVHAMIHVQPAAPVARTRSYVHLMRAASKLFQPQETERLAPRLRGGPRLAEVNGQGLGGLDPIAATEAAAFDFLAKGGKHSRPFIVMAVHDALSGANGTLADGADHLAQVPDAVRRTALAIETFHKASLVHDDIEDDDTFRYGEETLHRRYGTATAINVGDYLIGLGYRLVSRETGALGSDVAADLLDKLAEAHMKLAEGQGAELLWRDGSARREAPAKPLTVLDVLKIYALKTAPAFEAALYCGARLAGSVETYREPLAQFARHLGVAFQILNDLKDWDGDDNNKLSAGGDVLGRRPTVLWALAVESLSATERSQLDSLPGEALADRLHRVRRLYRSSGVFDKAARLVEKYRERAEAVADAIEPEELRRLLYYLIDTVLEPLTVEDDPPLVQPALPI